MFESAVATIVCFIACHGGPADHFSTFAEELESKGYRVEVYATGPALKKFQDRKREIATPFSLENKSEETAAAELARKCVGADVVITDVGHAFDVPLQEALALHAPKALRLAYYDNPEGYVPGGYSAVAAKVMVAAQGVLFANSNLVNAPLYQAPSEEVCLPSEKRIELGYYPIRSAEKIAQRRIVEQKQVRSQLFSQHSLSNQGQKILVYAGGNNEEYFSKALPAFLKIVKEASLQQDLSHFVILLQQHPGAKEENVDGKLVQQWVEPYSKGEQIPLFVVSKFNSDDAQVIADAMIYYQTSMGPQFVLAGIPTIQVGHNTYEDILVKNGLCSVVTDVDGFLVALDRLQKSARLEVSSESILQRLGIRSNWPDRLEDAIKNFAHNEDVSPRVK